MCRKQNGEAGACRACGNVVCHRCSCGFVCDPAGQFWEPFPNDHEISGNYADEQYPSEGKFFEAAGCLYDRHLVFYAVCTCDCVFVLCTGTGTETAEKKIRIKKWYLCGVMVAVFGVAEMLHQSSHGEWFRDYLLYIGIPLFLFLPLFVLLWGKGKNGMKGKIKKYVALVLSVQQLLCGCSATELEDRCFPMIAVVDEKDGQISFWLWISQAEPEG